MNEELTHLALRIALAGFGAVGVMEWMKNFFKFKKTWIYALIMPIFAVGCFLIVAFLPSWVIGSILTVGVVQLNYQVIVQGFKAVIKALMNKAGVNTDDTENTKSSDTVVSEEGTKDYDEQ